MYCQHCGFPLQEKANFCPRCGKRSTNIHSIGSDFKSVTAEKMNIFNRDVLVIYLRQVQTLEFSIQKMATDLRYIDDKISKLGHPAQKHTPYHAKSISTGDNIYMIMFGIVISVVCKFIYNFIRWDLFNWGFGIGIIIAIGSVIAIFVDLSRVEEINKKNIDEAEREYVLALQREETEKAEKARLINIRSIYSSGLEKAYSIRDQAYNINILPEQFRNIYAVYYLYNYLSTSQLSLESAMLHFDLNEIKQELNQIIAQIQIKILQDARTLANTAAMMRQMDTLLQTAIKIEQNSEYANLYAKVAAVNLDTFSFTNTVIESIIDVSLK